MTAPGPDRAPWRLRVEHRTGYRYTDPVSSSYNEARLTPVTDLGQTVLESSVTTVPGVPVQRYWDYWGTQVTAFDLHVPHDSLEVVGRSVVETSAPEEPSAGCPGWDRMRSDVVRDVHVEMLSPTALTTADPSMAAAAREAVQGLDPVAAARAVLQLVHDRVEYRPGATGVHSRAAEVWELRAGVCQDLAHVALALLREVGLPALYVSGYLHPSGEAARVGEPVLGESHAWVEVWLGDWWAWDPTGGVPVGQRHVVVARGRDYADVVPIKGVYAGGGQQSLQVRVEVTRLA